MKTITMSMNPEELFLYSRLKPLINHYTYHRTNHCRSKSFLLQHTDWNISEVAYALGFEYPTYFNNFFKNIPEQIQNLYMKQWFEFLIGTFWINRKSRLAYIIYQLM